MKVETIRYALSGKQFAGELVYDETVSAGRPTVLVCPSWMGVDKLAVDTAKSLAGDRYVMLVADLFGEGVRPKDHKEAAAQANALRGDRPEMRRRLDAALAALAAAAGQRGIADGANRAAIGFCFGGGNAMELARSGADLQAVVSFHGEFDTDRPCHRDTLKAAVLILHGSADPVTPKAKRDMVEAELDAAGATWRMVVYGGALHSYTTPGVDRPESRWDEAVTRDSYARMHEFLADAFAGRL